jgi:hypothetical protein
MKYGGIIGTCSMHTNDKNTLWRLRATPMAAAIFSVITYTIVSMQSICASISLQGFRRSKKLQSVLIDTDKRAGFLSH